MYLERSLTTFRIACLFSGWLAVVVTLTLLLLRKQPDVSYLVIIPVLVCLFCVVIIGLLSIRLAVLFYVNEIGLLFNGMIILSSNSRDQMHNP